MSAIETDADERCASCGTAGGDDVTLKNCNGCFLVKYCSVECQRDHISRHLLVCKKRAAELKDELLFKQPESNHLGDCPICLLPIIPIFSLQDKPRQCAYYCCSKIVCVGCVRANALREREARLPLSCPFCRTPLPEEDEQHALVMKRIEKNDPTALGEEGLRRFKAGDLANAIQYFEKAAGLGYVEAHYHLSIIYYQGLGAEKDMEKYMHHAEQAAIGGHPIARYNLGVLEEERGNIHRAVKHWMIAASFGYDNSIEALKEYYEGGMVSEKDFAAALRACKAAVNATKSPLRDAAEAAREAGLFM